MPRLGSSYSRSIRHIRFGAFSQNQNGQNKTNTSLAATTRHTQQKWLVRCGGDNGVRVCANGCYAGFERGKNAVQLKTIRTRAIGYFTGYFRFTNSIFSVSACSGFYSPPSRQDSSSASSSSSTSGFSGLSHELVLLYLAGGGVGGGGVGGGGSGDDALARAVRATEVLVARDPITWNWPLIVSLLKWSVALANGDEPGTAGGEKDGEGRGMDVGTNAPRTLPTRARTPTSPPTRERLTCSLSSRPSSLLLLSPSASLPSPSPLPLVRRLALAQLERRWRTRSVWRR